MNKKTSLQLVRNATLKIQYAGTVFLIDPVFAEKGTLMSALGVNSNPRVHLTMPVSAITQDVDAILLTHNHIDHYEPSVKEHLPLHLPFFTQPEDKEAIEKDGFTQVEAIDSCQTFGEIRIHRIKGHHGTGKLGKMMGPVSGYMLQANGYPTLYIQGDCIWEDVIRQAVEEFKPEYIVVNSGGAIFPEFSKDFGPIIPDEQMVVSMMKACPHTRFIAVHMDAIDHCQTTRAILRNEVRYQQMDNGQLIVPEDGETVEL